MEKLLYREALYNPVWGRSCHVGDVRFQRFLKFLKFKAQLKAQLKKSHTIIYIIFTITLVNLLLL
jgi:hypothetical protein